MLWYKIAADLGAHKARTLLAVLSMAAGVFAIGALFGLVDLLLAQLDAAHRESAPSHINIILRSGISAEAVAELEQLDGVQGIDPLNQITARYRSSGDPKWRLGTIVMRPDYTRQRFDRWSLQAGQWPLAAAIAIERLSASASGIRVGDRVTLETTEAAHDFAVAGIIRHPFVKPPPFGGQLHFFVDAGSAEKFGLRADRYNQLLIRIVEPYSAERARQAAIAIQTELGRQRAEINVVLFQDPDMHWGRNFVAGMNLVLVVMAWVSLVLSAVLVLNTTAALITQETDQIGIIKSIGGRRRTIAAVYLTQVLSLSAIAVLIAAPASVLVAHAGSRYLLDLFNVDVATVQISATALRWMAVGGVAAPLLAAGWPILRGAAMRVREAIASYGLGADFGTSRFDRVLEHLGIGSLPTVYATALGNLFRRKARLAWTQAVLVIAGVLFLVVMSLIASVNRTLDNEMARSRYDVRLGLSMNQPTDVLSRLANEVAGTKALEFWYRAALEMAVGEVAVRHTGSLGAQLLAVPVDSVMFKPLIVAGRWFEQADHNEPVIVLSADTAELNGIQLGESVRLDLNGRPGVEWRVIGFYRWLAGINYAIESVYAPLDTVWAATRQAERASFALVQGNGIQSMNDETAFADGLKARFEENHMKLDFYTTVGKLEQRQYARNQFKPVTSMLLGVAMIVAAVGAIGLSGTLMIGVLQRVREIGVLRALGARSLTIFKLFALEGIFHGILAWIISLPLAYLTAEPLARQLGITMLKIQLDYEFDARAVFIWLALVLALALIAAYGPARSATRISVRESLSYL